jgi:hypothetical protein
MPVKKHDSAVDIRPLEPIQQEELKVEESLIQEEEAKSGDIWQKTRDQITNFSEEMKKVEEERLARIKELIPRYSDGFNLPVYEATIKNCPLKHYIKSFSNNYHQKFRCFNNLSLFSKIH